MASEWKPELWVRATSTNATFTVQVMKKIRVYMRKFALLSRCDLESSMVHGRNWKHFSMRGLIYIILAVRQYVDLKTLDGPSGCIAFPSVCRQS